MIEIYQGEDKTFTVALTKGGLPYDLTDLTAATIEYKKADNTTLQKTLGAGVTVNSPRTDGVLTMTLDKITETDLLMPGQANFRLTLDFGSIRVIKSARNALIVRDKRY